MLILGAAARCGPDEKPRTFRVELRLVCHSAPPHTFANVHADSAAARAIAVVYAASIVVSAALW